jgi:hypothetical protein
MAEDGVADYATAKIKAARQAGSRPCALPDNSEIEAALREYQGLYQKEEQPAHSAPPARDRREGDARLRGIPSRARGLGAHRARPASSRT